MITKINFTDRTIKSYAIRKFTPLECFRLMGVRDDVIRTMQSTNAEAAERVNDWKGMSIEEFDRKVWHRYWLNNRKYYYAKYGRDYKEYD